MATAGILGPVVFERLPWQSQRPGKRPPECYCFTLQSPHKLYRFCAGGHYAKGKSIRDER
jgi:hypothetical protein